MQKCSKCRVMKSDDDFYEDGSRPRGLTYLCKKCIGKMRSAYQERTNKKNKVIFQGLKGNKCKECGYNKCHEALEFHHRDPDVKTTLISKLSKLQFEKNKEMILEELDKCDLLCANCHRELHHELRKRDKHVVDDIT